MRKLNQTKRQREQVIQAWLDPHNADEKAVLDALEALRDKHGFSTKQTIMKCIIWAAKEDGLKPDKPYSMTQITKMFKTILQKVDGLVVTGEMPKNQAVELVSMFEPEMVRFEELDPAARSLAKNYTGFQLNQFDDDED